MADLTASDSTPPHHSQDSGTLLPTPQIIVSSTVTYRDVFKEICQELRTFKRWTDKCTLACNSKPIIFFNLDKARYLLKDTGDLIMNPVMMLCPFCCKTITLNQILCFDKMLNHLELHDNDVCKKISEGLKQFMTGDKFNIPNVEYSDVQPPRGLLESYYVHRDSGEACYTSHWMSQLCKQSIVKSTSLIFQENDALITQILSFPRKFFNKQNGFAGFLFSALGTGLFSYSVALDSSLKNPLKLDKRISL